MELDEINVVEGHKYGVQISAAVNSDGITIANPTGADYEGNGHVSLVLSLGDAFNLAMRILSLLGRDLIEKVRK